MPRHGVSWLVVLCLAPVSGAACDRTPTDAGPPVASIVVEPARATVDLGATVRLEATPRASDGAELSDPGLTWRTASPHATVDEAGVVVGVSAGEALIEAVASNGTVGSAAVRVSPVSGLVPDSGRYGGLVTVAGDGLPAEPSVYFTATDGGRVAARTRTAGPTALEVWVPVGAVTGPLELVWAGDSVVTSHAFRLTAPRDVYADAGGPVALPFPFVNPALLAGPGATRSFRFNLPEPSSFSLRVTDRGATYRDTAVRAWLFRLDASPATLLWFGLTREQLGGNLVLDSVVYSRASLPAGEYALLVAALDLAVPEAAAERAFGLELSATASFEREPDDHEPNDHPGAAPLVALPFGTVAVIENPYAMDHYAFEVVERSAVTVSTSAESPSLLLFLMPDGPADVLEAWETDRVLMETAGGVADQSIQSTVEAGRYTVLVWDWGGRSRPYALDITAAPAEGPGSASAAGPAAAGAPGARSGGGSTVRAAATPPARQER